MEGLDGGLDGGSGWRAWVEGLDGGPGWRVWMEGWVEGLGEGPGGGPGGGPGWRVWVKGLGEGPGGGPEWRPGSRASMVEDHSEQFGCCLSSLQGVLYRRIVYLDYLAK